MFLLLTMPAGALPNCALSARGVAGLWEVSLLVYGERLVVRRFEGCSLDSHTTAYRETDAACDVREGWRDGAGTGWESGIWIVVNQLSQERATGSCKAADDNLGPSNNVVKSATFWPHPIEYRVSAGNPADFTTYWSTTFDDSHLVQQESWETHCYQLYRERYGIPDIEVRERMGDDILTEYRDPVDGAPGVPPYCNKILGVDEAGYGSLQHLAPPDVRNMTLHGETHEDVANQSASA